jgi:hypothetical protein
MGGGGGGEMHHGKVGGFLLGGGVAGAWGGGNVQQGATVPTGWSRGVPRSATVSICCIPVSTSGRVLERHAPRRGGRDGAGEEVADRGVGRHPGRDAQAEMLRLRESWERRRGGGKA